MTVADQPDDIVIRVRGLMTRFGAQTVHDGLDLDVRRGEVMGVVGGSGSAESVGRLTTQSVVESIFLVIVADAAFSVLFSILRI